MFFHFSTSRTNAEHSLFETGDIKRALSVLTIQNNMIGSVGNGTIRINDSTPKKLDCEDMTAFISVLSQKISGTSVNNGETSLVQVSDESTFQLSLVDIVPDSYVYYNEYNNTYGFSHNRQGSMSNGSRGMFGGFAAWIDNQSDMFQWKVTPENEVENYNYTLDDTSPFFAKFHEEMTPFIKDMHLQHFLHLGRYFLSYDHLMTEYNLVNDKVISKIGMNVSDVRTALSYFQHETPYIFEKKKYFPNEFEAIRKVLVRFYPF